MRLGTRWSSRTAASSPPRVLKLASRDERRGVVLDVAGLLLCACFVIWTIVAAKVSGGDGAPSIILLLACAAVLVLGRLVGTQARGLIPGAIAISALALALLSPDPVLDRAPLGGPFGYANATGAFYVQTALASLMAVACSRTAIARTLWLIVALALGVVPFVIGVRTSAVVVIALLVIGLIILRTGSWHTAIATAGTCAVIVLLSTILLGVTYRDGQREGLIDRVVDASLTERRIALWNDAVAMMVEHPLAGIGPSRFAESSPTARSDVDARWAHNGFLQQGAETGIPGLLVLIALFAWGFVRLAVVPRPDAVTALGAAALAVLSIHASVDYVLEFAAVPLIAAALVGVAQATPTARTSTRRWTRQSSPAPELGPRTERAL
jgi:O-Antigen ligase